MANFYGGEFTDAAQKQEDRLETRRKNNRDLFLKFQEDAIKNGRKLSFFELDQFRTELAGGDNYFTGYIPHGEAMKKVQEAQNERAQLTLITNEATRVQKEAETQTNTAMMIQQYAGDSEEDFFQGMNKRFGEEETQRMLGLFGGTSEAYARAKDMRKEVAMGSNSWKTITSEDTAKAYAAGNKYGLLQDLKVTLLILKKRP